MAFGLSLLMRHITKPPPVTLVEHTGTNRAQRRHFQDTRAQHAMSKKWNIPKDQQQPAINEPYRKPKDEDADNED